MKLIAIGDIHGHNSWKQIIDQEQDADEFVFVGDYFDSFTSKGPTQIDNFLDIIEFKKQSKAKVTMLLGNHDYHYYPGIDETGTSGYQPLFAPSIKHIINENKQHLQIAYQVGEFVFSHAGLSSEWLDDTFVSWDATNMVDKVNELLQYQPNKITYRSFKYYNYNEPNQEVLWGGGYGDENFQGPIWIRPRSLMRSNYNTLRNQVIQVVGHTPQKQIDIKGHSTGNRYYFIDTLPREYLVVKDKVVSLGKLENEKTKDS
jgi:hypothetical protein